MSEAKKEIIKTIQKMSGKYALNTIFSDWVMCSALAIQNSLCLFHDSLWETREEQYISTMKKYTLEERQEFVRMLKLLTDAFEEGMSDILGEIYMESGCGSKSTGQFFTPFHLSKLTAELSLDKKVINEDEPFEINEPSVGGGGMIIAVAAILKERGINYQKCMRVVGQDLDWRSVYMAYVQFSLLGIDAILVQGDTLMNPYDVARTEESHIFRTPKRMGVLL
jgi:type I restriction-modification system DNA methylase subunit